MDNMSFVIRVAVVALAAVLVAVIAAMVFGLFTPTVSNDEIFKIIGPAFQGICGGFLSILSAKVLNKRDD